MRGRLTRKDGASGSALTDYRCYNSPADNFNYQPLNLLTTPVERSSFFGKANYKINDWVEAYATATYTHSHSGFHLAPLPFDSVADNIVLSKDSIYNPFGTDFGGNSGANPDFTLRTFLFGSRQSDTTSDGSDFNGGVKGDISDTGWKWDANVTYSRLQQHANISGYYFGSKLSAAVGPSFLDATGVPTCGTVAAPISGCTPINLFNQDANPASALAGVSANYNTDYVYTYKAVDLDFNGKVFTLPAGDIQAAVGFEYNDRRGNSVADQTVQALPPLYLTCGLSQETCTGNAIGTYNSKQEYLELLVPILKDLPLVKSLNVDVGVRHNDYSLFGKSTKGDFKVEYRPVSDLLLRGTFSQVLRVPTINDIAAAPVNTSVTFNDPCNGLTQAASHRQCESGAGLRRRAALTGTFKEPNGQITGLNYVQPNLKPETGKVKTGVFVFEPSYVQGLSLEVDYWDYHIDGLITTARFELFHRPVRRDRFSHVLQPRDALWREHRHQRGADPRVRQSFIQLRIAGDERCRSQREVFNQEYADRGIQLRTGLDAYQQLHQQSGARLGDPGNRRDLQQAIRQLRQESRPRLPELELQGS